MPDKNKLKRDFRAIYPKCKLFAISHYCYGGKLIASVFYKDASGQRYIDTFSNFDITTSDYMNEGGNIERQNNVQVVRLFENTLCDTATKQTNWYEYTNNKLWSK